MWRQRRSCRHICGEYFFNVGHRCSTLTELLFFTYFIIKPYLIFQGAGAATFLISFFLQFPFTMYCQRKDVSNFSKLLVNFFVTVVGVIATVNTFRGYWYIMDVYLMPGKFNILLKIV